MNKKIVFISFMLLQLCSGIQAQTQSEYSVRIEAKDTLDKSVSFRTIDDFWSKTNWSKRGTDGTIYLKPIQQDADCMIIKRVNDFYNAYYFVERGQHLDLKAEKNKFTVVGTSLVARQNQLLQVLNADYMKLMDYAQAIMRYNSMLKRGKQVEHPTEVSVDTLYQGVEAKIDAFVRENSDASEHFIRFVRLENKYFKIKNSINFPQKLSKTYFPFSAEDLNQLSKVLEDSKYPEAIYSFNYRFVLQAYMDYLRIEDPKKVLGSGTDFLMNEVRLADYMVHPLLKQYLIANNLYELYHFNLKNEAYKKLVEQYAGVWAKPILEECASFKPKVEVVLPAVEYPVLSGINPEGQPIKLSDFKGKWVVIDFWATWCGPCLNQIPYFLELKKRCKELPVVFLGVSVDTDSDKDKWVEAVKKEQLAGPQMLCTNKASVYAQFAIAAIPHFVLIDPNGKLYMNGVPFPTTGIMERLLKDLTKK